MYYQKLNLPYPLKSKDTLQELIQIKKNPSSSTIDIYDTIIDNPIEYLNPELLEIFRKLNVNIKFVVFFGYLDSRPMETMVHYDVEFDGTSWNPVPCGLNWEFNESDAELTWYDSGGLDIVIPTTDGAEKGMFSGAHFKHVNNSNSDGAVLKATYHPSPSYPALYRTGALHKARATKINWRRLSLSIRFENIETWEQAIDIFSSYAF